MLAAACAPTPALPRPVVTLLQGLLQGLIQALLQILLQVLIHAQMRTPMRTPMMTPIAATGPEAAEALVYTSDLMPLNQSPAGTWERCQAAITRSPRRPLERPCNRPSPRRTRGNHQDTGQGSDAP